MFVSDPFLQSVMVKGEVSNCKYHSSGHIYFTLKDPRGTLNCVMFAGNRGGLSFRLSDGYQVVVSGNVDVYEKSGSYQLYAKQIRLDGTGALYERYEQLKRELEEQGMFDSMYKQAIPVFVKTLGVVTAPTGAAVRDIIQVAKRRNPYVQIVLYPAIVQGEEAPQSIVNGIRALEKRGVDVMIVGRGGGSIEDLWAFNERIVAQAIFDCQTPIISAVGHETDTTIADYVADLRAPTPSAAAELSVMDVREVLGSLGQYRSRLGQAMEALLERKRQKLLLLEKRLELGSPQARIREMRHTSMLLEDKLSEKMKWLLQEKRHNLELLIARMKGLSPLEKLSGGYAYVENDSGRRVTSVTTLQKGEQLSLYFRDGTAKVFIDAVQNRDQSLELDEMGRDDKNE